MTVTRPLYVSLRILAAALLALAACSRPAASPPSPTPFATHSASHVAATPTAIPYFDAMMGAVPAATVYVFSGRELLAVTLLNHFVRYRIPVADHAQAAVSSDGSWLVVADEPEVRFRLRLFSVDSGTERASHEEGLDPAKGGLVRTGVGRGALAFGRGGQLLALRSPAGAGAVVEAFDLPSLRPLGGVFKRQGCADRLVASPLRVAIVCLGNRLDYRINDEPNEAQVEGESPVGLAGAALLTDGTLVGGTLVGEIIALRPGGERVTLRSVPTAPGSAILRDAVAERGDKAAGVVIAQGGKEPRVFVYGTDVGDRRGLFPLPNAPASGILAFGQFAYWVDADGTGVYHVDLTSGLVEKMYGPLENGASLAALAPR